MKISSLLFLLSLFNNGHAQSAGKPYQSGKRVSISGKLENGNPSDTFQVIVWPEYINHLVGTQVFNLQLDEQGNFSVRLPLIQHITRVVFQKRGRSFANLGNFAVEPGDSILIRITPIEDDYSLSFTGKGSLKYALKSVYTKKILDFNIQRRLIDTIRDPLLMMDKLAYSCNSFKQSLQQLLDSNKNELGKSAFEFLSAEYGSYINSIFDLELFHLNEITANPLLKGQVSSHYSAYISSIRRLETDASAYSIDYIYSIVSGERTRLLLDSSRQGYTFLDLYTAIKRKYTGLVREKALMAILIDPAYNSETVHSPLEMLDTCTLDAYHVVRTPYIKKELARLIKMYVKKPAYQFTFPDTSGKEVSLRDFKGKTVLLDMWFTGCSGCVQFEEKLKKEIEPALRSPKDLAIVSICTDVSRQLWLKSLNKGIYSSMDHVNLYTGGIDLSKVPMINYYQIQGMPFILLIDKKGNIASRISSSHNSTDIVRQIKEAMNK